MSESSVPQQPSSPAPVAAAPSPSTERRGLLDIKVRLSNPSPTAGSEFTVYMLVTNLFDVPIWPESPQVFLPSELRAVSRLVPVQDAVKPFDLLVAELAEGRIPESEAGGPAWWPFRRRSSYACRVQDELERLAQKAIEVDKELELIEKKREEIRGQMADVTAGKTLAEARQLYEKDVQFRQWGEEDTELARQYETTSERAAQIKAQLVTLTGTSAIITEGDLSLANFSLHGSLYVQAKGNIHLDAPQTAPVRALDSSSLRPGIDALQPGNTAVYSLVLATKRTLFFRPIQYTLEYSINFSFDKGRSLTYTNSASQDLTIRAPVTSVMGGAILGGVAGYVARFLQEFSKGLKSIDLATNWAVFLLTLGVTVILSAMAVVFLARKSETQSLLSIEDFWGGLVIGFLVGYTGTSAFESFAGINTAGGAVPAATPW
jgi:hypothetical protein